LLGCVLSVGCKKENSDLQQAKVQAAADDKIIQNFLQGYQDTLKANNWTVNQVDSAKVPTGIYYIIVNRGDTTTLYTNTTQVTVGYNARLLSTGQIVAYTNVFHPAFVLSQVIRGWRLGIPQVGKGGEIRLIVPSRSAYGPFAQPNQGIPANSILYFDIKLYDVTNY